MIVGDIRWGLWGRTVGPYGGGVRGGVRILTSLFGKNRRGENMSKTAETIRFDVGFKVEGGPQCWCDVIQLIKKCIAWIFFHIAIAKKYRTFFCPFAGLVC